MTEIQGSALQSGLPDHLLRQINGLPSIISANCRQSGHSLFC